MVNRNLKHPGMVGSTFNGRNRKKIKNRKMGWRRVMKIK